jgi:D-glycero-D-manno-heptose 1,7-bisphosphate phosphatase
MIGVSAPYLDPSADELLERLPAPRKALFLDRDGVINVNHGYVHTAERTDWVPGIFDLVARAYASGFAVVVVTNQAGIARGYYGEEEFGRYTAWVHEHFSRHGMTLLATYHCPHHPAPGMGQQGVICGCRKPAPGMLLQAARDFDISLGDSLLIGDQRSDIEAANRAGVPHTFLLSESELSGASDWLASLSGN